MDAPKKNRRGRGPFKEARRELAKELQAERAQRTDEQQLALLDKYGYAARKERAKLKKRIEARAAATQEKTQKVVKKARKNAKDLGLVA